MEGRSWTICRGFVVRIPSALIIIVCFRQACKISGGVAAVVTRVSRRGVSGRGRMSG